MILHPESSACPVEGHRKQLTMPVDVLLPWEGEVALRQRATRRPYKSRRNMGVTARTQGELRHQRELRQGWSAGRHFE